MTSPPPPAVALRVNRVARRYGAVVALGGVSLDILRGEVFGLLGPNGAGKTTLLRVIVGLLEPDEGRVELVGEDARTAAARGRLIGVCPQELVLWEHLTCLEQLELVAALHGAPAAEARQRAGDLLARLGLTEKARTLAKHLSGGMKRRLNLALAVVHEPRLLLLDEPEAGLDPQARVLVRELVRSLAGRMTIILTSHNMDEVERTVDRVGIIDQGQLLVVDSPAALAARVGAGDLLSIELAQPLGEAREGTVAALEALRPGLRVSVVDTALSVHGLHVLDALADVVNLLRSRGVAIAGLSLRENSLEDVFLTLTGKRLS